MELLVVISIIAVLAGLIIPAVTKAKVRASVVRAQQEANQFANAINQYYQTYKIYPASKDVRTKGVSAQFPDFTYGTYQTVNQGRGPTSTVEMPTLRTNNSELTAILMDFTDWNTKKRGNPYNSQGQQMLNAKMASDAKSPGIGIDGVYRDPWGNPYIVSLDLNYDGSTRDLIYSQTGVAAGPTGKGLTGLYPVAAGASTVWELRGGVMVWSMGPDKNIDPTKKANVAPNKDNILSWQ